ncbi:hypothetical protein HYV43_04120 [Candidatus Micrarchaeota archaeon]|nr:hypothetical protein [Candidatus Micrarchaeota archaeon]
MTRFPSRTLYRHLKRLSGEREAYVAKFCAHMQRRPQVYRIGEAILALNELVEEKVIPAEQIQTKNGPVILAVHEGSPAQEPVKHGLNVLLWEQAIRMGEFSTQERQRIRNMYTAHLHQSMLFPDEKTTNWEYIRTRKREANGAVLDLVESERFEHIHEVATKVAERVRVAIRNRKDTPHRQLMGSALKIFDTMLTYLKDSHESRDKLREAFMRARR